MGVIFSALAMNFFSNHFSSFFLIIICLVIAARPNGTATYNKTEKNNVSNGTRNPAVSPKSSIPVGANNTKIIKSLIDTWISAQLRFALARYVHTRVIAVHGANPKMIIPITYSFCRVSEIKSEKTKYMKTYAIIAIVNGFTPQFTINVNDDGFAFFLTLISSVYFTLSIIGYIIISKTMAIGIDTFACSTFARDSEIPGK